MIRFFLKVEVVVRSVKANEDEGCKKGRSLEGINIK